MSKQNPYDKFLSILGTIGLIAVLAVIGAMFVFILIIYPIVGFANGEPWYDALGPVLLIGTIVGIVLLFEFGVSKVWKKFVSEPWRRKRDAWDRAEWEREDALPLDPEPYVDYEDETIRYADGDNGWHRFQPREGYNPHSAPYGIKEYGW